MKVRDARGYTGEVLTWEVIADDVYFRVIWYGMPGTQLVHHTEVFPLS